MHAYMICSELTYAGVTDSDCFSQLGGQFMVRVQCVLWPRGAAEAAAVQAELWEPLHHGPSTALRQPHPTRVHTGMSAQPLLPLGGQIRVEHGRSTTPVCDWEMHLQMGLRAC